MREHELGGGYVLIRRIDGSVTLQLRAWSETRGVHLVLHEVTLSAPKWVAAVCGVAFTFPADFTALMRRAIERFHTGE